MKKIYFLVAILMSSLHMSFAAPRYWVGPLDGNWNNTQNWSATSGGPSGASVPGINDDVFLNGTGRINIDISPKVKSLTVGFSMVNFTLYTSVPTTFTVDSSLAIQLQCVLKDSTSADVPFNFILNGASGAGGFIIGNWIFEGGVPVSNGNGPGLTTEQGARLRVQAVSAIGGGGGRITYRANTADISSDPSSLLFNHNTFFIMDNNPEGAIPNATWRADLLRNPQYSGFLDSAASTIQVNGNLTGNLRHLAEVPSYGRFVVNLSSLAEDASLALPSGAMIRGNLEILNTNNHTLTLLKSTDPSGTVRVTVGELNSGFGFGGYLLINGNTTKVTLARATDESPGTSYHLDVTKDFNQSGGNFSLQDYDNATGTSTLSVNLDLIQTGGTFFTNSTATGPDTRFVVEMDDPPYITGPSGLFAPRQVIQMSSGTIDNGRGMVTLRLNHRYYSSPVLPLGSTNGVTLLSPLVTGRLDMFRGLLNTTATNILTVTDPNVATAVNVSTAGINYVNGPLRRVTNSTAPYAFPVGKGNTSPNSFVADSCIVIPSTGEVSLYQAEYFNTGYADQTNLTPPLTGVSPAEYWEISKISGSDASVQLTLNASVPGTTANDVLVVAQYVEGSWISQQGTTLAPGNSASGSVLSKPLSMFGVFTFGASAFESLPPLFVNCPPDTTVRTDPNICSALVHFKAETAENATLVYRIGTTVITSPYQFPKGRSVVEVTASASGGRETCSFAVTVLDQQAPVISDVIANPSAILQADNTLKAVYIGYSAADNCSGVTTTLSVLSNQPQNGSADWEIIDGHNLRLRASATNDDRVYTITITAVDEAGNKSAEQVTVTIVKEKADKNIRLKVKVMNNPTRTYFTLQVSSNSDKPVNMQVYDIFGRIKEVRTFYADATIRLGDNYKPGVYFVRLTQGREELYLPLLKLPK